ncbi:hypothetical protein SMD44_p10177 (plasmid) [Streptomyces alboflavus]|uniref:Uncharacterized protein n=1 Tax=Streptomyces alboflavus TaxID=67267 RepID=A0A291W4U3_9ACTN|nr:hypothetical protein SMD44_p10177 [Streptomyces alboflavus]
MNLPARPEVTRPVEALTPRGEGTETTADGTAAPQAPARAAREVSEPLLPGVVFMDEVPHVLARGRDETSPLRQVMTQQRRPLP